ncbi:hypothetical protein A5649_20670 [Mycolicibacter heraklionensis]|uniref:Uncharacterized protein n=1 Tax=Mycolicibacter heraklionensis TaxID=512402 RepID=A0AA91F0Y0_9MYCO|nr:hypothetical protein A5649_20670 [Mycolicibacter heraklionensis]
MSLRCALLRLTMAGMVFVSVGPLNFFAGFAVSEIIAMLSGFTIEGAVRMAKESLLRMARIVESGKAHLLPYRVPLLTSL